MIVSRVGRVRKQKIRLAGAKESGTKASCRIQCRPLLYNRSGVSIGNQQIHLLVCEAFPVHIVAFSLSVSLFLFFSLSSSLSLSVFIPSFHRLPLSLCLSRTILRVYPFLPLSLSPSANVRLSRSLSGISPRATLLISAADIAIFTAPAGEIVVDSGKPAIMHSIIGDISRFVRDSCLSRCWQIFSDDSTDLSMVFEVNFWFFEEGILSGKNGEGRFVTRQIRKAIDISQHSSLWRDSPIFFDDSTDLSIVFEVNFWFFEEES